MTENVDQVRQAAHDRLTDAWRRGYMDAAEHERRTTALRHAESTVQVEQIERGDLRSVDGGVHTGGGLSPIPPVEDRGAVGGGSSVARVPEEEAPQAVAVPAGSGRGLSPQVANAIRGAVPFLAVILFFATENLIPESWIWFLLIPLTWTVLPALTRHDGFADADGHEERREQRRELKRARRSHRREIEGRREG